MAGQGRLCQSVFLGRLRRLALVVCATLWVSGFLAVTALGSDLTIDARLQYRWEADEARFWRVRLVLMDEASESSAISELGNLSDSELTTGALALSQDSRTFTFQPRHAVRGGAVQLRVRASKSARLRIEVIGMLPDDHSTPAPAAQERSLLEILGQGARSDHVDPSDQDSQLPKWSVSRISQDQLRVDDLPPLPVFHPGDPLRCRVHTSAMVGLASRQLTLEYSLYQISSGETLWSHRQPIEIDADGNSKPLAIEKTVPELQGVYELQCRVAESDNIWSRLRRREPPIVRVGRPIVVLGRSAPPAEDPADWQKIGEIRPSESTWSISQWLPNPTTRLIPGSGSQPADAQSVVDLESESHGDGSISLIPPHKTFQATLPVLATGLPHKITIRYPADRATRIRVQVAAAWSRGRPKIAFVLTGQPEFGDAGDWKTHSFIHYPNGDDQIWMTNLDPSAAAGFQSVTVEAGPRNLTDANRSPSTQRMAILRLADLDWVNTLSRDLDGAGTLSQCDAATVGVCRLWIATSRLCQYAVANGMNGVEVPACAGGQTWFATSHLSPLRPPQQDGGRLATFLRLMEPRQLKVFVGFQPSMLLSAPERAIAQQPALAGRIVRNLDGGGDRYNGLHPVVRQSLAAVLQELDQQCSELTCYAGLVVDCGGRSHLRPPGGETTDVALMQFASSAAAANRGPRGNSSNYSLAELRLWTNREGNDLFANWLRDETRAAYAQVTRPLTDRAVFMIMPNPPSPAGRRTSSNAPGAADDSKVTMIQPFADRWRGDGARLIPIESFRYGGDRVLARRASFQQQLSSAASTPESESKWQPMTRAALLGGQRPIRATGDSSIDVPAAPDEQATALLPERMFADVGRLVDRIDPSLMLIELPLESSALQSRLATTLQACAELPAGQLHRVQPADPASQTIQVRAGTKDGLGYVSMISLAPWTSEVRFECFQPLSWQRIGASDSVPDGDAAVNVSGNRVAVTVPAGELVVLRSATRLPEPTGAIVKSWSTSVSGGVESLKRIKRDVTLIVERIGVLSDLDPYDALTNGGFEQAGGGIGLVGWLHAQHPPGCVRIDDKESSEGKHSVLLTTDPAMTTRTWIVSETIQPPASGRLAVSLACRGELEEGHGVHRLRVSLEATRDREQIRYTNEFDVPRNGGWGPREIVLEADGFDAATVDSLRLTIDSLAGGRVWIDDVRLHDRFPTSKERAELQSQAFLAVQGLQRGNLTPSARLLQNHWARHLLSLGPAPPDDQNTEPVKPADETPGVADRIRSWLPHPLRF